MELNVTDLVGKNGNGETRTFSTMVGKGLMMRRIFEFTVKVAASDATVLITGEKVLNRTRGNKTLAAELLCLNRTTLIERIRKRGLRIPPEHSAQPVLPGLLVRNVTANDFSLTA